jgi:DHA2 family multidrug resistance protein-like MFS transporter
VALSALSAERSGSGTALITAMRQVGATIGVAALGTVLSSVYASRLSQAGLPGPAVAAAKSSVGAGVAVATKTRSAELLTAVHSAYAGGVDVMLWVCAAIAIAAAVLAALFVPRQASGAGAADPASPTGPPARLSDAAGVAGTSADSAGAE